MLVAMASSSAEIVLPIRLAEFCPGDFGPANNVLIRRTRTASTAGTPGRLVSLARPAAAERSGVPG